MRSNGANTIVQAAGYDGAGPVLAGLSIPTSGTAGLPLVFAVSPFDFWSALAGTPLWSFGDGSPAQAGTSVSHAYAAAGTYPVSVSQADALGNQTTGTQTVVIAAPPASVAQATAPFSPPKALVSGLRLGHVGQRWFARFRLARSASVSGRLERATQPARAVSAASALRYRLLRRLAPRSLAAGQRRLALGKLADGRYRLRLTFREQGGRVRIVRTFRVR